MAKVVVPPTIKPETKSIAEQGVGPYVEQAIRSFVEDKPDSPFQRGFLSALQSVAVEGLGWPRDHHLLKATGYGPRCPAGRANAVR